MSIPFPGEVFDHDGSSIQLGKPDLGQYDLTCIPAHSVVSNAEVLYRPDAEAINAQRTWLLNGGTRWPNIPPQERFAARAILREGGAVLVVAIDPETEKSVRAGLLDMIKADAAGRGWFGHA